MATLLDDRLVADALENLPDWTGDAKRLSRTVRVEDADALVAAVGEAADAMDHHPQVERDRNSVTFVLWTHSKGGVTELDIALASRIDDLILTSQNVERTASGPTVTAEPNIPAGEQTTPSRREESATGQSDAMAAERGANAPTLNEPATPRQDVGPVALPDAEPGSLEPQPGNAPAPGMHEGVDEA